MLNIGPTFSLVALGINLASAEPLLWKPRSASASKSLESRTLNHDRSFTDEKWKIVQEEYKAAVEIAKFVKDRVTDSNIDEFVGYKYQTEEWVKSYKNDYLESFIQVEDAVEPVWKFRRSVKSMTHTEGGTTTLCEAFFDSFPSTARVMQDGLNDKAYSLDNYESRATILLHEYLHLKTKVPETPFNQARECWGSHDCSELAVDNEDVAIRNPDNWMLVALYIYWQAKTNRAIPITVESESSSSGNSDSGSHGGDKCKRDDDPASPACIAEFEYPKLIPSGSGGFKPTSTGGMSPSGSASSSGSSAKSKRGF